MHRVTSSAAANPGPTIGSARAAAVRYREVIASNPNLRAHFNDPLITSPEQRWLLENDDATAGWLLIQVTLEANPKPHVVKEFREWMEEP